MLGHVCLLSAGKGACAKPQGLNQSCDATMLLNPRAILTRELCNNEDDDDFNGKVDKADKACWLCGDGVRDPNEQCDVSGWV